MLAIDMAVTWLGIVCDSLDEAIGQSVYDQRTQCKTLYASAREYVPLVSSRFLSIPGMYTACSTDMHHHHYYVCMENSRIKHTSQVHST